MRALQISASGAGSSISQAEIEHLTERTAAGLLERGIGAGDVVLVRLPKGLRWLAAMRALHRIAAVSLPCPHMLTEADVADRAARSQARCDAARRVRRPHR